MSEEFKPLQDSGHRQAYASGAIRERAVGKGRYDLIPPEALRALAEMFEKGALKYGDRNWERGLPLDTFIDSGMRHLVKLMDGDDDEDHAALAMINMAMYIATRARQKQVTYAIEPLGDIDVSKWTS